jgi:hypothetical protein
MSRVLLFVQSGDARPKMSRSWRSGSVECPDGDEIRCALAIRSDIDRWWLVECENANAGRATIADAALGYGADHPMRSGHEGRILASGGRS